MPNKLNVANRTYQMDCLCRRKSSEYSRCLQPLCIRLHHKLWQASFRKLNQIEN